MAARAASMAVELWPSLPFEEWRDTCATLHRWMQIVGKVRLGLAPPVNHWWHVTFYLTARGLTTSAIPYHQRTFDVEFDFIDHQLTVRTCDGGIASMPLAPRSVAEFYANFMDMLHSLELEPQIWPVPVEVEERTPFDLDRQHASYDAEYAGRFWRILAQSERVLQVFRSRFLGKCSPVHFFWGSFDLAVTRFSGREAPRHPPVPNLAHSVVIESYSHEVSSCGFWPGGGASEAVYYSYAYPEPKGFGDWPVRPDGAFYSKEAGEFLLPYEKVRQAANPEEELLAFVQSTYDAAAELAGWDRGKLERPML